MRPEQNHSDEHHGGGGHASWSPAVWLATGLGVGASPVAPGTLVALWGIPIALAVYRLPDWRWHVAVLLVINLVGVPICGSAAKVLGVKDPGAVVWDEFATVPLLLLWVPRECVWQPSVLLVSFVLHRLFDISKLPPVRQLERLPGGWGIMADDWFASLYGWISLQLLLRAGLIPFNQLLPN